MCMLRGIECSDRSNVVYYIMVVSLVPIPTGNDVLTFQPEAQHRCIH